MAPTTDWLGQLPNWLSPAPSGSSNPNPSGDLAALAAAGATAADAPGLLAYTAAQQANATQATANAGAPADQQPNAGQPNSAYTATVATSSVGQAISDMAEFGLTGPDASAAIDWYNQEIKGLNSPAQMQIDMYQQPWFQKAFPGIIQQIKNGQSPMSPQDYITFKQGVKSFSKQFGIPDGFITDGDVANMVGNGLTFNDFTQRVGLAFQASNNALVNNPKAVALLDQWYGIKPGSGALAAFYLDPNRAVSTLATATTAAQGGAAAELAGFTKLDQNTLMALAANRSLSDIQGAVAQAAPLLPTTRAFVGPGQSMTVSESDLLAAQLGGIPGTTEEQAAAKVNVAKGQRTAAFTGGGGEAGTAQAGTSGLGFGTQ